MKRTDRRKLAVPNGAADRGDIAADPIKADGGRLGFFILILLSGCAALIYQILWMRQLGLVFGNTAHAAALTLGIFFLGLASGSAFWGWLSPRLTHPLRSYAWLELGIGLSGVLCLPLLQLYRAIYPSLYIQFDAGWLWLAKALLALVMVFPGSFLMGGTIPLMGKFLVRQQLAFGRITASIYGLNTLGAATGAFAAAFLMLPYLGFRLSCLTAVAISVAVALLARRLGRHDSITTPAAPPPSGEAAPEPSGPSISRPVICLLAFVSGFSVLGLEVLWTRMFALVHENSVYSFAAILVVVLLALAAGAWLASHLARRFAGPVPLLHVLCLLNGLAVWAVPTLFMRLTDDLQMLPEQGSFAAYVAQLFLTAFGAIGLPCLLLGVLFPFLMKAEERFARLPGRSIGLLAGINTTGAILGSLVCGFLLLETLGMWRSMQVLAALYLLVALLLPAAGNLIGQSSKMASLIALLLLFNVWNPAALPVAAFDPDEGPQVVVERWEASDSTVTVVRKDNGEHAIRINSNYSLGSSEAYMTQIYQTRVPLLAFPETKSIFYLGMGTGITAGEALDRRDFPQIERITVCELSPQVITAAYKYFGGSPGRPDLTNGLFKDPRAKVLAEDGRNHLMASSERYDMINADLFLPYRSGSGSLYSLEHFRTARERLNPGGVFVQWLPLYQLTEYDFGVITHTMLETFEHVTLWRNHFQPGNEVVALVGHVEEQGAGGKGQGAGGKGHGAGSRGQGARGKGLGAGGQASGLRSQDSALSPPQVSALSPQPSDLAPSDRLRAVQGARATDLPQVVLPVNEQTIRLFYAGNLSGSREHFQKYPLNTDDRPIIEFGSPRTLRSAAAGTRPHFVGGQLADLVDALLAATPPVADPMLAAQPPATRHLPLAGAAFHRAWIAFADRDIEALETHWDEFLQHWLASAEAGED